MHVYGKDAAEDPEASRPHAAEDSEVSKPTAELDSEVKLTDEDSEVSKPADEDSKVSKPTDEDSEFSKPTDEVSENDWEKLVSAMFTGAELSDSNLAQEIRGILEKYAIPGALLYPKYFPKVTALYQENHQGVIVGRMLVSDVGREHVEQQFLKKNNRTPALSA